MAYQQNKHSAGKKSVKEHEFCLSVMNALNISGSLGGRKHSTADLFKSVANRLKDTSCHTFNVMLAFSSAKPPVSHSGLISLRFKKYPAVLSKLNITGTFTDKRQ